MSSILEVRNLSHTYGENTPFVNDAVQNVNFSVERGEIVGIIGHTGSGKSTLIQHLNGLLKPTTGEILIEGKNIWDNPKEIRKVRSRVGLVFQYPEYQLFEETVYDDIAFGPKNMGLSGDELKDRVLEICDLVGVKREFLEESPFDLSGGEKRRVAIAGVMAMRPEIIVFDEPVAGLDPQGRNDVVRMIRNYRDTYGATVLIVSHNMEDMAVLADKLLVMSKGNLVAFDTTDNIFGNADFLQSIGLNVPIVTRVFKKLREMGAEVPSDVFTVERAVSVLLSMKGGGKNA